MVERVQSLVNHEPQFLFSWKVRNSTIPKVVGSLARPFLYNTYATGFFNLFRQKDAPKSLGECVMDQSETNELTSSEFPISADGAETFTGATGEARDDAPVNVSWMQQREATDEGVFHGDQSLVSVGIHMRFLFALNGLSLSLQSLPLMYIVNTRVAIPLTYLPTYGAIAFLPYSLKPIYAFLGSYFPRRQLLTTLLVSNGISIFATTLIPSGGLVACFVASFFRGVADSWAEFNLGLTLIDNAHLQTAVPYDKAASIFQSQAATSRNIGALTASAVTSLLFLHRVVASPDDEQLSGALANNLMITATIFNFVGGFTVWRYRESIFDFSNTGASTSAAFQPLRNRGLDSDLNGDMGSESSSFSEPNESDVINHIHSTGQQQHNATSSSMWNVAVVVSLQLAVVSLAFRGPLSEVSSPRFSSVLTALVIFLFGVLVTCGCCHVSSGWGRVHRVGLFLLLRHTIPDDAILLGSFRYNLFQDEPLFLQLLSLVRMATLTLSSWSFTRMLASYSGGKQLVSLVAGTTMLAGFLSLTNLILINQQSGHNKSVSFAIAAACEFIIGFSGEWKFLPDIVLATTSVERKEPSIADRPTSQRGSDSKMALQYGSLISCIDFGDQLGALLGGPLVSLLGISRENEFANLDRLIWCCSAMAFLSLLLLPIIPQK